MIFKNLTAALLNSKSEINAISYTFTSQLGLQVWKTNVGVEKINGTLLKTYEMVVSTFFMLNKNGNERFFEESFLLAGVNLDMVLSRLVVTISNANIDF